MSKVRTIHYPTRHGFKRGDPIIVVEPECRRPVTNSDYMNENGDLVQAKHLYPASVVEALRAEIAALKARVPEGTCNTCRHHDEREGHRIYCRNLHQTQERTWHCADWLAASRTCNPPTRKGRAVSWPQAFHDVGIAFAVVLVIFALCWLFRDS